MTSVRRLIRSKRAAAAAEMALVTPLLLTVMLGSVEVGNYFYNEHLLVKAVRDGARYAARQNFSAYGCSGAPTGTIESETKSLVMTSLLSGGTNRLPQWNASTITLSTTCLATVASQPMTGIYRGKASGAPVVTVTASVPYVPAIGAAFGFSGSGLSLNASQQAAVTGI